MSREPEIKMVVLLGRSPADKQVLVTWAFEDVPSGFSLRGPYTWPDMRLLTVSDETSEADVSESKAAGFSGPLG